MFKNVVCKLADIFGPQRVIFNRESQWGFPSALADLGESMRFVSVHVQLWRRLRFIKRSPGITVKHIVYSFNTDFVKHLWLKSVACHIGNENDIVED